MGYDTVRVYVNVPLAVAQRIAIPVPTLTSEAQVDTKIIHIVAAKSMHLEVVLSPDAVHIVHYQRMALYLVSTCKAARITQTINPHAPALLMPFGSNGGAAAHAAQAAHAAAVMQAMQLQASAQQPAQVGLVHVIGAASAAAVQAADNPATIEAPPPAAGAQGAHAGAVP